MKRTPLTKPLSGKPKLKFPKLILFLSKPTWILLRFINVLRNLALHGFMA